MGKIDLGIRGLANAFVMNELRVVIKGQGMDSAPGEVILEVAVMSIVFTAPLGALAIKIVGERVLKPATETTHAALDALSKIR